MSSWYFGRNGNWAALQITCPRVLLFQAWHLDICRDVATRRQHG